MTDAAGPSPDGVAPVFTIYNLPPSPPRWDRIGIAFITFCATWTLLVFSSMLICLLYRNSIPALRVRCLPLSFTAIAFLHAYWILAWLVYPIGGTMPVVLAYDIQYFFMGIWFPLGIAVFHASNLRFLHVARRQRRWLTDGVDEKDKCSGAGTSLFCRIRHMAYVKRVMMFIGLGMVLQVFLTVGMWVACKKYHPTLGIPGTEIRGDTLPEQMVDLGRGWEWWPSVLWQVIWTWIVAPYLIWRVWGIRDTMGWRTQTIGCCLSNLHATPMFLIASYVSAFDTINTYFPPSQWIHLSIMMIEIFAVFIPLFQLFKYRHLARTTASLSARWDTESQTTTSSAGTAATAEESYSYLDPVASRISRSQPWISLSFADKDATDGGTLVGHDHAENLRFNVDGSERDKLLTMSALERVLAENPIPLQDFSAISDFSGENIAFLRRVDAWKVEWHEHLNDDRESMQNSQRLALYNLAIDIYNDFVSPSAAEFPINLSSRHLSSLKLIFEPALSASLVPSSPSAAVAPFDHYETRSSQLAARELFTGEVPVDFDMAVFDTAQAQIKYLVLTNTWPKFVAEMTARRRRSDDATQTGSVETNRSGSTLVSRVPVALQSLVNGFRSRERLA